MPATLNVDGQEFGAVGLDQLSELIAEVGIEPNAEILLTHTSGASLRIVKNGDVALLMLRHADAESRSQVSFDAARRAAVFFWPRGAAAPFVQWHDDGQRDAT